MKRWIYDKLFTNVLMKEENKNIVGEILSILEEKEINGQDLKYFSRNLTSTHKTELKKQVDILFDYYGKKYEIEMNRTFTEGIRKRNLQMKLVHLKMMKEIMEYILFIQKKS